LNKNDLNLQLHLKVGNVMVKLPKSASCITKGENKIPMLSAFDKITVYKLYFCRSKVVCFFRLPKGTLLYDADKQYLLK